jgi:hypothetical protein
MSRLLVVLAALLLVGVADAQQVRSYTQVRTGANDLVLGYPVPVPVPSLTPVDGFRDYASLLARLQSLAMQHDDIAAHQVGQSTHGHGIWAYVVGSPGSADREGRSKPAFFINATTHAREWQAPEVATGLVERMAADVDDGGLVRYLLDNSRLVIIPVQNVDGFLQTQQYPSRVLVGADPCWPDYWPRDGRMRRKNMRGTDFDLHTIADHLAGVDLNRNHPPFHATRVTNCTGSGSSSNPNSLVWHGPGPHSEPEHRALLQAATLAPASRLRLGIDVHSYSRVFFSSNTGRPRLNQIQGRLLQVLAAHHAKVPTHDRAVHGVRYADVLDPANSGIGAAAEYFAYQWLVPAWTLELEPGNDRGREGGREYGGLGVTHDGFILPDSEIRRVREAWAESHLVAFYFMAGPPHLARLRLFDAASGTLLRERRWHHEPAIGQRVIQELGNGLIQPGQRLRAELAFSKPMRHRVNGQIAPLPGPTVSLTPRVWQSVDGTRSELPASQGSWLGDAGWRYRDDSFAFEFDAPSAADFGLEVEAWDMVGLALDADPASPADWSNGAWSGWENAAGVAGDSGGIDLSHAAIALQPHAGPVRLLTAPRFVAEGDALRVPLRLDVAADSAVRVIGESVELTRMRPLMSPPPPPAPFVEWAPGETGERVLVLPVADDTDVQGDRQQVFDLGRWTGGNGQPLASLDVTVLDNDSEATRVWKADDSQALRSGWNGLSVAGVAGELVLKRGSYWLPMYDGGSPPNDLWTLTRDIAVFGNGAELQAAARGGRAPLRAVSGARLSIDHLNLRRREISVGVIPAPQPIIEGGAIRFDRVVATGSVDAEVGAPLVAAERIELSRSVLRDVAATSALIGSDALQLASSSLIGLRIEDGLLQGGAVRMQSVSVVDNQAQVGLLGDVGELGGSLLQRNQASSSPSADAAACAPGLHSLGFNVYDGSDCPLDAAGDLSQHPLPLPPAALPSPAWLQPVGAAIDAGGACPEVDQRGTPRPQTMVEGAEPRCDVGAIELGINPYRGMWIPARDGHGIDLHTVGNRLFLLWYTFDDGGEPTAYQAMAPLTGPQWRASLQQARRDVDSGAIVVVDVGEIGIDFDGNTEATLRWQFAGREPGSESMRAFLFAEGEPRFEVTGTWYPPAESGNGATVVRRGEVTAAVVYYYDAAGALRWALGSSNAADAVEIELASYTGFCPDCDAAEMPVAHQPAGRALLHFITPLRARVDTELHYPGPAGGLWRRERAEFVPLNDLVDNRYPLQP